jgi:Flp pilus assembly protein TadD
MDISQESDSSALAVLSLNREFYPKSSFNEWATGQIYAEMGDTANAVASLEKAVEFNPKNRRAKRDLDMLKGNAPKKP